MMPEFPQHLKKLWRSKRYHSLNAYLRNRFGEKVYRVSLDAGFTCPNRDGAKAYGGCLFCDEKGARASYVDPRVSISQQLEAGMRGIERRYKADKFIAYFQAYTNTYADTERLWDIYRQVLDYPRVVGVAIGTRPDCLDERVIEVLKRLAEQRWVLVEVGVQSALDRSLQRVNRRHSVADSRLAIERLRSAGLDSLAHLIFGLPGEDKSDMLSSLKAVIDWGAGALKLHHLYAQKGTALEGLYHKGEISFFSKREYLELLCDFLPVIPPEIVLHRLFGQSGRDELLVPEWTLEKNKAAQDLERLMEQRGIYQGSALDMN